MYNKHPIFQVHNLTILTYINRREITTAIKTLNILIISKVSSCPLQSVSLCPVAPPRQPVSCAWPLKISLYFLELYVDGIIQYALLFLLLLLSVIILRFMLSYVLTVHFFSMLWLCHNFWSIHLLMDTWVASSFWALQIKLLWTLRFCKSLCEHLLSFLFGKYLGIEWVTWQETFL